jgi:hypothetical protein
VLFLLLYILEAGHQSYSEFVRLDRVPKSPYRRSGGNIFNFGHCPTCLAFKKYVILVINLFPLVKRARTKKVTIRPFIEGIAGAESLGSKLIRLFVCHLKNSVFGHKALVPRNKNQRRKKGSHSAVFILEHRHQSYNSLASKKI